MKILLKKVLIPIFIGVLLGYICAKTINNIYEENENKILKSHQVYVIEGKTYNDLLSLQKNNIDKNYAYYKEGEKYKTIIGITKEKKNIEKITALTSNNTSVKKYVLKSDEASDALNEYDNKLLNSTNNEDEQKNVDEMLKYYQEHKIKLQKVS